MDLSNFVDDAHDDDRQMWLVMVPNEDDLTALIDNHHPDDVGTVNGMTGACVIYSDKNAVELCDEIADVCGKGNFILFKAKLPRKHNHSKRRSMENCLNKGLCGCGCNKGKFRPCDCGGC